MKRHTLRFLVVSISIANAVNVERPAFAQAGVESGNSMAPVEDKGRLYRFETFYTIGEYLDWAAKHPDLAPGD